MGCAVRGLAALVEAAATEASKAAEHPAGWEDTDEDD